MLFNKHLTGEEINKKPQFQAVPEHRVCSAAKQGAVAGFLRCAIHKHTNISEEIYTAHLRRVQKDERGEGNREATSDIFMRRNFAQASAAVI